MRLLLDTHAALWWLADDPKFSDTAAGWLDEPGTEVLLSAVVVWEVAIKRSLGKLDAPTDLRETLIGAGALPLAVSLEHAACVGRLPWHHRDPFDRLLVAQAQVEDATVVSDDSTFGTYGVPVAW